MAVSDRAKDLIGRYRTLKGARSQFDSQWEDLARVMLPQRMGFVSDTVPGERRTDDLFDGTPMQAARGLANATGGFLRPDGQKFFFIKTVDDRVGQSDEAKEWLAAAEDRMIEEMLKPKARFRQATGEVDLDLVVLGTGIIYTGERAAKDGLLFQSLHLKSAVPFFSDEGDAEGMFRERCFKVRQLVKRFGEEALSEGVRRKIVEKKLDDDVIMLHCVVPRAEGRADALLAKNLPFASIWIELAASNEVEVGGFHEFPFAVPRWDTSSGETYGRSPGMIALPDADTLQAMGATILIAGQRAADPPLLVPDDGFFDGANSFPGGLTYYNADLAKQMGKIPVGPLETGANLPITRDMQNDERQQVFAAFFKNVLNLPVEGPQMTAEEVRARKEEFIREIGPVFGRLESDYTAPIVERTFSVMLRAGALPPIPQVLAGQGIRFEYESPVKKIRQQVEAAAARLWVQDQINIAKATQDPSHLDIVDWDEYSRFTADAGSVPHTIVVGKDKVQEKRQARAQEQAQQARMAQASQAVDLAARAADVPGVKRAVEGTAA
jgi:hypothetical protein